MKTYISKKYLYILFVFLFSLNIYAAIDLPQNLTQSDREQSLKILGYGLSNKILSDPWPLGGYSGLEIGVTESQISVTDLKSLGSKLSNDPGDLTYTTLSIGKGLYNNIDVFFTMTPYLSTTQLSQFGGIFRYNFFQAEYSTYTLSFLVDANYSNIQNRLSTKTIGTDLIGGYNTGHIGIYLGIGQIASSGEFLGGSLGLTKSQQKETEEVRDFHSLMGINLRWAEYFLALQMDHFTQSVYSLKLGLRY